MRTLKKGLGSALLSHSADPKLIDADRGLVATLTCAWNRMTRGEWVKLPLADRKDLMDEFVMAILGYADISALEFNTGERYDGSALLVYQGRGTLLQRKD